MKNCLLLFLICTLTANAQLRNDDIFKMSELDKSNVRQLVRIPDFGGYHTMKCDLHSHTVFSDGDVWPTARVIEAWQHGLDAIAITDHMEHGHLVRKTLAGDFNSSYDIASQKGKEINFIVIKGAEISRAKPFGHMNALFITDANPLSTPDPLDAIEIALKQGAFIMWNHPGYPDNKSTIYPVQEKLIREKKIHGIEVFNEIDLFPVCLDWCKNMEIAFTGNSDIHELASDFYGKETIRPMTLVFAPERTEKGIKEALFAGRTAAYFNGYLAGRPEYLSLLIKASLEVRTVNAEKGVVEVTNHSDISYRISFDIGQVVFPAGKTVRVTLPKEGKASVLNCFTGMNEYLSIDFPL